MHVLDASSQEIAGFKPVNKRDSVVFIMEGDCKFAHSPSEYTLNLQN